jgi:hypothetical protein
MIMLLNVGSRIWTGTFSCARVLEPKASGDRTPRMTKTREDHRHSSMFEDFCVIVQQAKCNYLSSDVDSFEM